MRYNVLTAALIATIALCMTGCVSSRTATSERLQLTAYSLQDTVREQVVVTVFDTITETTTITVVLRQAQEPNELDDTVRVTQITDKTKATTRDRYHDVQEKVVVKTDTVYIERDSLRLTAYSLPGTEIDKDGNVTRKVNRFAQSLKWLFLTLVAIIALIIIIRLKLFK